MKMGGMCLNWKVIAGLVAIGLGIWLVAPNIFGAVLPLLLVAACPLSMLLMMRGMQGMQGMPGGHCQPEPAQFRHVSQATSAGLTREEQLADLKAQLASSQAQQEAMAREITELEAASAPAVREAEAIARAADERTQGRS